jgi:hypothetical protein
MCSPEDKSWSQRLIHRSFSATEGREAALLLAALPSSECDDLVPPLRAAWGSGEVARHLSLALPHSLRRRLPFRSTPQISET